jgi:transcriptional regulator with XRE-family HTH domain
MNDDKLMRLIKIIQGDRSIRSFAADCHISPAAVSRIYKGEYMPSTKTLEKMANPKTNPQGDVTYEQLMVAAGYQKDYVKDAIDDATREFVSTRIDDVQRQQIKKHFRERKLQRKQIKDICIREISAEIFEKQAPWEIIKTEPAAVSGIVTDWSLQATEKADIERWDFIISYDIVNENKISGLAYRKLLGSLGRLALLPPNPKIKYTLIFDLAHRSAKDRFNVVIRQISEQERSISYRGNLSIMFIDYTGQAKGIHEIYLSTFSGDKDKCITL